MASPSNVYLPPDVIQEILLRLPVKTLCRFKCVCKHWCAFIGSPSFVQNHFCHESNQERLLIRHDGPEAVGYAFALYVDEMCSRYEEPDHLQIPDSVEALLGPFNGVFCVVNDRLDMALLNPATRQFRPLPVLHWNVQPQLEIDDYSFGFGLDPLSGDYKAVLIQFFWNLEMNVRHYPPLVSVYNSGSDSWGHFEDVDLFNSMEVAHRSPSNAYLNGVYYWLMELKDDVVAVLALDMSSDKFQGIQVPNCIESDGQHLSLALNGNSIALLSYDSPYKTDVWVMEQEGCWTRSYTVGHLHGACWPLGFLKNNELLLETGTSLLILYNFSTKKSRTFEARGNEFGSFLCWVFSYKESLVSIKREGANCKLWDTTSDFVKNFFRC